MNAHIDGGRGNRLERLRLRGAFGAIAVALAVLSCYGVLALTALLPLLGIRLLVDPALWGGAIIAFTALTVVAVLPGARGHRSAVPGLVTLGGAGLVVHALLVEYRALAELAGFVLLVAGVVLDVRLRRARGPTAHRLRQRRERHP